MTLDRRPYAEVIGDPIDHSLSPVIHCFWLKKLGIRAGYRRFRVGRGELEAYLDERRKEPEWRGCNVTMPLKLDALALADEPSDRAIGAGAANLLIPRGDMLAADNTDVGGILALVERLIGEDAPMSVITLLGSGGAARAALMALHLLGKSAVRIQSRNLTEAYNLAVQFGLTEEPRPFHMAIDGDGLINATPLGMTDSPPLVIALDGLAANGWVMDFVSSPSPTELIRRAQERGLRTVDGIDILVEQAGDSFVLLFGAEPPRQLDRQLVERLRK